MSNAEPPYEEGPTPEDTQEIPPALQEAEPIVEDEADWDEEAGKKPKRIREIGVDAEGNKYLIFHEKVRKPAPRSRRFQRRPRYTTRWVRRELQLKDNEYVDLHLVAKIPFVPVEGEESILAFNRLHWWSHGPEQILIGFIAAAATITTAWLTGWLDSPPIGLMLGMYALFMLGLSGWYATVWIPWAYMVLIVTDRRIILVYAPPFALGGTYEEVAIEDVQNISTHDQTVGKWIPAWGNILAKLGLMGYKVLRGDTSADDDDWIRKGIKYVRGAENIQELISSQRAKLTGRGAAQHEEAMGGQQAVVDLLQQLVDVSRPQEEHEK